MWTKTENIVSKNCVKESSKQSTVSSENRKVGTTLQL